MDSLNKLHNEMRACQLCLQAGYEIVPGAVFRGEPTARVMLVGQAPGVTEVEAKRPFLQQEIALIKPQVMILVGGWRLNCCFRPGQS